MSSKALEKECPQKKVVSTYLQYIFITLGVLLLLMFVRRVGGVLLTFLLGAILSCVLNPLVQRLEHLVALLVLIIPAMDRGPALIQHPKILTDGATGLFGQGWKLSSLGKLGTIRDRTVRLFRIVGGTLVKYLKAQLLLCEIMRLWAGPSLTSPSVGTLSRAGSSGSALWRLPL